MATFEQYQKARTEINDVLTGVGAFLGDLCTGPAKGEHEEVHAKIDEQLQRFFTLYYDLRKRHEDACLSVAVLALTKSGLSEQATIGLMVEVISVPFL